ncbi:DEAD/DEAH box helicase [Methylotetracoccus oryzae]|uniref:DEAD/DEAH box helicase n=1 Tax=Methylotetracoccus oryzae TaxID=1919059 RepID=UPI001117B645|nr:helicase-related protein [Methylotetracoccus oryzae]
MTGRFSAESTLHGLKDFQRRTVDYVFRRLFLDEPATKRFLVADEVGLGKTLVAAGVIAKTLEHLQDRVDRVDFIYVCSNAAIAHQNVARLNVRGEGGFALASRLTLLPTQVKSLRKSSVNFVSFTPGTTFDLKSRSGLMSERVLLFRMLQKSGFDKKGLLHMLQGPAGRDGWESAAHQWFNGDAVDADLQANFVKEVGGDLELTARIDDVCARFHRYRANVPQDDNVSRYDLIGHLRQRLARVCLHALEPDLVILDEFQRFRNLLRDDDPTADLAQELFNYPKVRVMLLSATPYKMLSLDHEQDDDHYPDFIKTLRFLLGSDAAVESLKREIEAFRRGLLNLNSPNQADHIQQARDTLRHRLQTVMCRTERVGRTVRQDAMLSEPARAARLLPHDLMHARLLDGASIKVGAHDAVEYWKSVPYAINTMKGYDLRRRIEGLAAEQLADFASFLHEHRGCLLRRDYFERYQAIDPANARLRVLFNDTLEQGLWKILWMPPSLPNWRPEGPFERVGDVTKSLVFSAWNVVPDAIASLCSYEAERRAVTEFDTSIAHSTLYDRVKPLLRFSRERDGRLTGMPALLLLYPSPTLASLVDPVSLSLAAESLPSLEEVEAQVTATVREWLAPHISGIDDVGRIDERWYWIAPALLDRGGFPQVQTWLSDWGDDRLTNADEEGSAFREHVEQFLRAFNDPASFELGRPPDDLATVLARLVLAGPAICASRSLRRSSPDLAWDDLALLKAAAAVGSGFRTLFNLRESIAVLRGEGHSERYWLLALEHGLQGNLGALLDEQVHVLKESLGVAAAPASQRVESIGAELRDSLSIRTSQLTFDELRPRPKLGKVHSESFKLRCRFALRFGDMKDEQGEARTEVVRAAFNSPFRPFVLASTSVGQEGLDFHLWCHAVMHWNLPSNPVDLEQREGRVHRYKGHAVRKNVAAAMGRRVLRDSWQEWADPWQIMFTRARDVTGNDLQAFWLFETENGACVERRVPLLPLSRDSARLAKLKRGLALYRLVFGQPRQEDLLAHLSNLG